MTLPIDQMIRDAEALAATGDNGALADDVVCHVKALAAELEPSYRRGFVDALSCFAHWKDGVQYVGTCGATLNGAIETLDKNPYYTPGQSPQAFVDGVLDVFRRDA